MWGYILPTLFETVVLGLVIFYIQRGQKKRDSHAEERATLRRRESLLNLQMTMAVSKLSYATAVAIERGKTNGELKEAKEEYSVARAAYLQFLNEQAADHLTEE